MPPAPPPRVIAAAGEAGEAGEPGLSELFQAVSRRVRRSWIEALEPYGLAPHQARALLTIVSEGPIRPGHLASSLRIAPRSATDVIDALEERGLIDRAADPDDRRALVISATASGRELAGALHHAREDSLNAHFDRLSPADRAHLRRILLRLHQQ